MREIAVPLDVKNFRCVLTEVQPLYYHYVYTHSRTKINLKSLCSSGTLEDCLEEVQCSLFTVSTIDKKS